MKKLFMIFVLLAAIGGLLALPAFECVNNGDAVSVTMRAQTEESAPVIQKTLAMPSASAAVAIHNMRASVYNANGELLRVDNNIDPSRVVISNSFTMREMRAFTVRVEMEKNTGEGLSRIEQVDFDLQPVGAIDMPSSISEAFIPVYQYMAANYETSYLPHLPVSVPHMLIVSHQDLQTDLNSFAAWKRSRGMEISSVNIEDISASPIDIKNWIANFYNTAENKPDYLLLVGDVDGDYVCPTFYTSSENDVADINYALIEGDDYLPEMLVGRFSISSDNDFRVMTRKVMMYEMSPEVGSWMERTLVVAGNHADEPPIPVTPVMTSRWLHDQMVDYGYAQVDTVFYPQVFPGTTQISNYINAGVQMVSYRGWGAADGWHFPIFHTSHAQDTESGNKMPIVTSIVCNTGDFSDGECFGEGWMRMGTPSEPQGCVAFMGPSDLHTSTEKNNAICAGFYHSVFYENVRSFGTAVLRGKAELYNNYPNNLEFGDQVEFYFWVYNILTDPSLNMWSHTPPQLNTIVPTTVQQGENHIVLTNLPDGAVITTTRDYVTFTRTQCHGSTAIIPLDTSETGDINVTVWHKSYIPKQRTITVVESDAVGVTEWTVSNMNAGSEPQLNLTVTNYGADIANLTADLNSDSEYYIDPNGVFEFGAVSADATANASLTFGLSSSCPDGETIVLTVEFSTGETAKIELVVNSLVFEVVAMAVDDSGNGVLDPGETSDITLTIMNSGAIDATGLSVALVPSTDALTVNSAAVSAGDVAQNATTQVTFNVEADEDAFRGRNGRFQAQISDTDGRTTLAYVDFVIGVVDNTAPTGPDNYGYYCYDSNDTGYDGMAPTYEWLDLDPALGGPGDLMLFGDDWTEQVTLPFTFDFYGEEYSTISICSNGWVSMGETWQVNFRNWNIPAALGPGAMIAPYWDDLKGFVEGLEVDDIRIITWSDTANDRYYIQWIDAYNSCNNSSIEQFALILQNRPNDDHDDIYVMYHTVDNPDVDRNYCTVGIQSTDHEDGVVYTYANHYPASASELTNGLALRFTTDAPDDFVGVTPGEDAPAAIGLEPNWPNPFNPETNIAFSLDQRDDVELTVYNLRGQRVATVASGSFEAGRHTVTWHGQDNNGASVGSGVYLYRLRTSSETLVRRMVLLK